MLKHSFFLCIFYSVLMIYIIFLKCFVSNCVSFLLNLILYFLITRFAVNIINYLSYFSVLFQNGKCFFAFSKSLLLLLSILRFNFKQKCFCLLSQKSHFCCHSLSKTSFLRNRMKSVSCLLRAKTDFL